MVNKRPEITLSELEETAVHTPTQEECNILMRVYECGDWRWCNTDLPTQLNSWFFHKEKTCIEIEDKFAYSDKEFYQKQRYKIISTQKFYDIQNITPEMLREINEWFETKE